MSVSPTEATEDFVCQLCFWPLVDPRILPCCDEVFCSDCLVLFADGVCPIDRTPIGEVDDLPKFTDKRALRRLGALIVFCPNKTDGECDWKGPRENLEEHITRTCQFTPCTHVANGCTWRAHAREVEAHVKFACPFSPWPAAERAQLEWEEDDVGVRERLERAIWIRTQLISVEQ